MGLERVERSTSPLSGVRSNQLSYRPAPRACPGSTAASFSLRMRAWAPAKPGPGAWNPSQENRQAPRYGMGALLRVQPVGGVSGPRVCLEELLLSAKPVTARAGHGLGLRKEVIQPQVLLRLPCYDFTPVINTGLDACLPLPGWRNVFCQCQLPWCDGRCVQGPGTYSPHHAVVRLLAIPASCSRVADCNPN